MITKNTGFIPKEMYMLIAKMTDLENPIRWSMCSPNQMRLSFTMYYEGGQWRHFIVTYNLDTLVYTFSCVYYYPEKRMAMGEEIKKEEWGKMGHSVSTSAKSAAEIIPPNDPECLKWLERKGVLIKVMPKNAKLITTDYKMFEQEVREHLALDKEYNKQELKILVQERISQSKNVDRFHKYLEQVPNNRIMDLSRICFIEAQSMNEMKTNQINPEQIVQIKSTFYGVINVDTI